MNIQGLTNILNPQQINNSETPVSANASLVASRAQAVSNLLNELSPGSFLEGVIVSKDNNELLISLNNDTLINAKLNTNASLNIGEKVVFNVKASDSTGVTLSPLYTNTDKTSTLSKALDNAGLVQDERNTTIVSSMMRNGMSINDKELIQMVKELTDVDISDIPDATKLVNLGIKPTADNIEQYNAYLGYEHKLTAAVDEIIDLLPETIVDMIEEGNEAQAVTMAKDLLNIFTANGAMVPLDETTNELIGLDLPVSDYLPLDELTQLTSLLSENGIAAEFNEAVLSGNVSLSETMYVLNDILGEYNGETTDLQLTSVQNTNINAKNISENVPDTDKSAADAILKLSKQFLDKDLNVYEENASKSESSPLKELIKSKPFSSIIKAAVNSEWKLNANQVGEEKQVSHLYKRMTEQTERILHTLENQTKQDSPLAMQSSNLAKNMNFMNELNNMFNYVQLPMRFNGNDAHGELYVYTNKKHLASEDGTVSALLHLDMDNLGPTDVYVAMNSANHVNTHFYLPDEESLDLIALHIDELNSRLEKRGYSMSAEYTTRDEETNVMKMIVEDNKSAVPISINNFDARA